VRRRYRLGLTAIALASSIAVGGLLIWLGSRSEGPITASLERIGTMMGSIEHGIQQRVAGGTGRSADLAWFSPYRNAREKLRQPEPLLLGAYDSGLPDNLDGVVALERSIGTTLPLIQIYVAWGDKPEQQFPRRLSTAIWDLGSVPVITWEPWLTDFENALHPELPLRDARDRHGLAAVARGDYDFYIDKWAADAARFGKTLFLRPGHEMNDPYRYPWGPQNNTKEEYIAAWRHIRGRFDLAGAKNVIWTWSPHVAYLYWETYYPGDDVVDWVATGVLNFGLLGPQWAQWWSFQEIFGSKYDKLAAFGKPIMIAEFGSLAVGGDRVGWYRDALTRMPAKYPAVKAILFFNVKNDQTVTYQKLNWTITDEVAITSAVADQIKSWNETNVLNQTPRN
jgi:hypothetical protein